MHKSGFMELDFALYFEPENGIRTDRDFTSELLAWARRENRDITILQEGMEPRVEVNGKTYRCQLGDPDLTSQKNPLRKILGLQGTTHSVGKFLGYQWVYLYEV